MVNATQARSSINLRPCVSDSRPQIGAANAATKDVVPPRMPAHKLIAAGLRTPSSGSISGMIGTSSECATPVTSWIITIAHKVCRHRAAAQSVVMGVGRPGDAIKSARRSAIQTLRSLTGDANPSGARSSFHPATFRCILSSTLIARGKRFGSISTLVCVDWTGAYRANSCAGVFSALAARRVQILAHPGRHVFERRENLARHRGVGRESCLNRPAAN